MVLPGQGGYAVVWWLGHTACPCHWAHAGVCALLLLLKTDVRVAWGMWRHEHKPYWQDSVIVCSVCLPVASSLLWANPELPFSPPWLCVLLLNVAWKQCTADCFIVNTYANIQCHCLRSRLTQEQPWWCFAWFRWSLHSWSLVLLNVGAPLLLHVPEKPA